MAKKPVPAKKPYPPMKGSAPMGKPAKGKGK